MSVRSQSAVISELEALSGSGFTRFDPPTTEAGTSLGFELVPESADRLSEVMKILSAHSEPVLIKGNGTKLDLLNRVQATRIALSCRAISGIEECDAADGVMKAHAGTPLEELMKVADEAGWTLPMEASGPGATLGGTLAAAVPGPRRLGFGAVRDNVLGLETTLVTGERTRCGARVVKNVTGYDMAKLYIGSFGTLAIVESAWLRLHPKVESIEYLALSLGGGEADFQIALQAARRTSTRAVVLIPETLASRVPGLGAPPKAGCPWRLLVECAGDETVTRYDSEWLADQATTERIAPDSMDALKTLHRPMSSGGLRARLHLLPSSLEEACRRLRESGFEVLAYPEPAIVHAFHDPLLSEAGTGMPDPLASIQDVAHRLQADWVIESFPESGPDDPDHFKARDPLDLMRALKAQFDPQSLLNRGGFVGSD